MSKFFRFLKLATGFFSILLTLLFSTGCFQSSKKQAPLVVGMDLSYPPFEMRDANGNPSGISAELAHALASSLNRDITILNIPFGSLIESLTKSKIDLIISSMTATEERAKVISFSDPYVKTGLCLLIHRFSGFKSISDVDRPGRTLAVMDGTTGHKYAAENIKQAAVLVLKNEAECALKVIQGEAHAFIFDQMSVYKNWQANPTTTLALLDPFQKESWAIGIRQRDLSLRKKVNAFLKDFRTRGGFERLGDHYLSKEKIAFEELGYEFFF